MEYGPLLILIPLIIYAITSFTIPRKSIQSPDDFFIAYKKIGTTPFANSAIAYAFQVATVYPFLAWASSKIILIPFLNSVFWGVGILLFSLFVPKMKDFIGSDITIHGFLGRKYSASIRFWTSVLTIIGLSGVAIAEIVWGSQVLSSVITDKKYLYFIIFLIAFFALIYTSYGGQMSSIRTDQAQLIFSYLGILGLLLYLFFVTLKTRVVFDSFLSIGVIFLACYIPLLLFKRNGWKFLAIGAVTGYSKTITRVSNILISLLLIALALVAFYSIFSKYVNFSFSFANVNQLEGFGIPGLLSLILLPLFWQFVDMTNWQRILSLQTPANRQGAQIRDIQKGLLTYAVESPFTWVIFIVLGLFLATNNPALTVNNIFTEAPIYFMKSESILDNILGYGFIVSIFAIMLSTVDSVIAAIMFAFIYDTFPQTKDLIDKKDKNELRDKLERILAYGRIFALVALSIGISVFVIVDVLENLELYS